MGWQCKFTPVFNTIAFLPALKVELHYLRHVFTYLRHIREEYSRIFTPGSFSILNRSYSRSPCNSGCAMGLSDRQCLLLMQLPLQLPHCRNTCSRPEIPTMPTSFFCSLYFSLFQRISAPPGCFLRCISSAGTGGRITTTVAYPRFPAP